MATRRLALDVQLIQDEDGEPQDELSDDELQGDFINESGRQVVFSDVRGDGGSDEYERIDSGLDPCYRSSLLLLDGSLNEVIFLFMLVQYLPCHC